MADLSRSHGRAAAGVPDEAALISTASRVRAREVERRRRRDAS